jgi:hypothetical protein
VFALSDVFHFFAHKLARLRAGRFAFTRILARTFDGVIFWHNRDVSPLARGLDVRIHRTPHCCAIKVAALLIAHRKHNKTVAISRRAKLLSRPCAQSFC